MADTIEKREVLKFVKHDWFQKADNLVKVDLYVKEVYDCNVIFDEDGATVSFYTRDGRFLKIHGSAYQEKEDEGKICFVYSIPTREKIVPSKSRFSVNKSTIELTLVKSVAKNWTSLEILRPSSKIAPKKVQMDSNFPAGKEKVKPVSSPRKATENLQLLGGKSTPFLKKTGEQENKPEKETAVASSAEQQPGMAMSCDVESKKNVNKTVMLKTESLGLTGLENYANNCYMNVVIQVLANIPEIRDYFIDEHFLNSLGANNPLSSGGRVAKAFYEVIKDLWSADSKSVVRPQVLKNIMGKRCSLFMGFQQCDAQEFFATLLDNLHEDLKQVPRFDKSKEIESKEDDSSSSNEKYDLAWETHIKRNNSMIVKLFHGQMVSKLTCQSCHKKSIIYEPCAQVSLPIPMSKQRLRILVFFKDMTKRPALTVLQVSSPHAHLWHLFNMLEKRVSIPAHCLRAIQIYRGSSICQFDEDSPISAVNNSKILVVCEVRDDKEADLITLPIVQHKSQPVSHAHCGYCKKPQSDLVDVKLKRCSRCMHIAYCSRECQSKHWSVHQKDCRKGYKESIGLPFLVTMRKSKFTYDALSAAVVTYASFSVAFNKTNEKDSDLSDSDQDEKNRAPKCEESFAKANDADAVRTGNEGDKSENSRALNVEGASKLAMKSSEQFIIKAFDKTDQEPTIITADDFKMDVLTSAMNLSVEWQIDNVRDKEMKELQATVNVLPSECSSDESSSIGNEEKCSIEDCISMFMEPDRIPESDGWKCPKCKTVQAVKKEMALSYPPPIMLVHFKRFTYASYGQKITRPIHYPISGLDISNYLAEETKDNLSSPPVYDLTGVICHRGSMGIGHYTCMVQTLGHQGQTDIEVIATLLPLLLLNVTISMCKTINGPPGAMNIDVVAYLVLSLSQRFVKCVMLAGWRDFDDDQVAKLNEDSVVSSSAYVLIYRMRGIANSLKLESPFLHQHATGSDVKQEKIPIAASGRSMNRQLSLDNSLKERMRSAGKVDSASANSSSRSSVKRSESVEYAVQNLTLSQHVDDNIRSKAENQISSETRLADDITITEPKSMAAAAEPLFDGNANGNSQISHDIEGTVMEADRGENAFDADKAETVSDRGEFQFQGSSQENLSSIIGTMDFEIDRNSETNSSDKKQSFVEETLQDQVTPINLNDITENELD
eukprot:gene7032-7821_t